MKYYIDVKKLTRNLKVLLISVVIFALLALGFGGVKKLLLSDYTVKTKAFAHCIVFECKNTISSADFEVYQGQLDSNLEHVIQSIESHFGVNYTKEEIKKMMRVTNHGDHIEITVHHDNSAIAFVIAGGSRVYIFNDIVMGYVYPAELQLIEEANLFNFTKGGVIIGLFVGLIFIMSQSMVNRKEIETTESLIV